MSVLSEIVRSRIKCTLKEKIADPAKEIGGSEAAVAKWREYTLRDQKSLTPTEKSEYYKLNGIMYIALILYTTKIGRAFNDWVYR